MFQNWLSSVWHGSSDWFSVLRQRVGDLTDRWASRREFVAYFCYCAVGLNYTNMDYSSFWEGKTGFVCLFMAYSTNSSYICLSTQSNSVTACKLRIRYGYRRQQMWRHTGTALKCVWWGWVKARETAVSRRCPIFRAAMSPVLVRRQQAWQDKGWPSTETAVQPPVAFQCWHSSLTAIFNKTKLQQFIPVGTTMNFINGFTMLLHRSFLSGSLSKNYSNNRVFFHNAVFQFIAWTFPDDGSGWHRNMLRYSLISQELL